MGQELTLMGQHLKKLEETQGKIRNNKLKLDSILLALERDCWILLISPGKVGAFPKWTYHPEKTWFDIFFTFFSNP